MANWYGTSRTNYFHVKNADTFIEEMRGYDVRVIPHKDCDCFALIAETEDGGWPCTGPEGDDGEYPDVFFPQVVSPHLMDNEVAVFMAVGAEKARYVTGVAVAIVNSGRMVDVSLDSIYNLAEEKFGIQPTRAEY